VSVSRASITRTLTQRGLVQLGSKKDPAPPIFASKPPSRTRPGNPTSPIDDWPMAPTP
jgi:hypothetical protein